MARSKKRKPAKKGKELSRGVLLAGELDRLYQVNKRALASKDRNRWPGLKPTTVDLIRMEALPHFDGYLSPGLSSGMTQARAYAMEIGEARESEINRGLDAVIEARRKRQKVGTIDTSLTD